jgi:hypothetical protein
LRKHRAAQKKPPYGRFFYSVGEIKGQYKYTIIAFQTNNIRKKIDNLVLYLEEILNGDADFTVAKFCRSVTFSNSMGQ